MSTEEESTEKNWKPNKQRIRVYKLTYERRWRRELGKKNKFNIYTIYGDIDRYIEEEAQEVI